MQSCDYKGDKTPVDGDSETKEIDKCEEYIRYFNDQVVAISRNSLWFNAILAGACGYATISFSDKISMRGLPFYVLMWTFGTIGIVFNLGSLATLLKLFQLTKTTAKRIVELEKDQANINSLLFPVYLRKGFLHSIGAEELTKLFYGLMIIVWVLFPMLLMFVHWNIDFY